MENHHFQWVNQLFLWAFFDSYVKLPEGIYINQIIDRKVGNSEIGRNSSISSGKHLLFYLLWGLLYRIAYNKRRKLELHGPHLVVNSGFADDFFFSQWEIHYLRNLLGLYVFSTIFGIL